MTQPGTQTVAGIMLFAFASTSGAVLINDQAQEVQIGTFDYANVNVGLLPGISPEGLDRPKETQIEEEILNLSIEVAGLLQEENRIPEDIQKAIDENWDSLVRFSL